MIFFAGRSVKREEAALLAQKINRQERDINIIKSQIQSMAEMNRRFNNWTQNLVDQVKEIKRNLKSFNEVEGFVYRSISLQSENILVRKKVDQGKLIAVPVKEYGWADFEVGSIWGIWENGATLYYEATVLGVRQSDGEGYVEFEVVGEPKTNNRSD